MLCFPQVVDNAVQQQQAENNELLNSFNVATFKNQEDDATFWSRLIAAQQEEEAEEEKLQPEVGSGAVWDDWSQVTAVPLLGRLCWL